MSMVTSLTAPQFDIIPGRGKSISARDICVELGGNKILRGLSFDVTGGEVVCIIGPSGSGKSTALRAINGLVSLSSGEIFIDGVSTKTTEQNALRQEVGMVFQSFNLFPHRTVVDNIALALRFVQKKSKSEARAIALERLRNVGLEDKAGFRPGHLSGGQQQRIAIARALALNPQIMLFDEATSALDPELVKGVLTIMAELAKTGMTMVCVTHEMGFARHVADRIIFMDGGRIIEQGPPDSIFDSPTSPRLQTFLSQIL